MNTMRIAKLNKGIFFILFLLSVSFTAERSGSAKKPLGRLDTGSFSGNKIHNDLENNGMIVSHRLTGHSGMEWPAGEHKYSNFASGVWFAGKVDDAVRTAVGEYGPEFVSGQWDGDSNADEHQLYIVNKSDLADPLASSDFQNWPAHLGAPWVDNDGDGIYSPLPAGTDHPEFIGDQVIWYVMNDGDASAHSIFGTAPLGIEVRVTIWGYDRPDAFGDMMFVKAQAYNKGGNEIKDMFIGLWDDPDLGYAGDDFVGCDTTLSLGYCYNDGSDSDYGAAAPAIGYDFFQASVPGTATDTAFAFGANKVGFKKLEMSSFTKYINGDAVYTDPADELETYNYMSGLKKDGTAFVNSDTGLDSKFVHPCDPNNNTGASDGCWVDSDDHASGDRRFLMNVGPFDFTSGDSLELVFGIMHAQGADPLNSVTLLKEVDKLAQLAYDIQFALPASPDKPTVSSTATFEEIILSWDAVAESYTAEDKLDLLPVAVKYDTTWATDINLVTSQDTTIVGTDTTITTDSTYTFVQIVDEITTTYAGEPTQFTFEGYNVWQHENMSGTGDKKLIATYDLVNNVTEIMDDVFNASYGASVNVAVQNGTDSGIKRWISIDKDYLNGGTPLINGRKYYYTVNSYGYNQYGIPKTLESADNIFYVRPQKNVTETAAVDVGYSAFTTTHSAGGSDGSISVSVVNPFEVTGNDYEVFFENQSDTTISGTDTTINTYVVWGVNNTTTGTVAISGQKVQGGLDLSTNLNAGTTSGTIFDGLQVTVNGPSNGIHGIFMVHDGATAKPENADFGLADAVASGGRAVGDVLQSSQWLNYPAYDYAANSNGGYYFATQGGGTAADEDSYYERVFRGTNFSKVIPYDFEMRFTSGGGKCWLAYTSGAVIDVPFELWNVGISTPDDTSDDYRMTCWIYDNNGSGTYDWHGELEDSGALNDPGTDWVYWRNPVDMTPGTSGYDATVAAADYGYPDLAGEEVMARTIWNNWNGYGSKVDSLAVSELSNADPASWAASDTVKFDAKGFFTNTANSANSLAGIFTDRTAETLAAAGTAVSGHVYANVILFPAEGSVYRWISNKPNAVTDKFTFSTSDAAPTEMTYSCKDLYVWPNPYFGYNPEERTAVDNQIHFGGLSNNATINIYDLSGNLVKKIEHTSGNTAIWDVKNSFDIVVASGMYIANIKAEGCETVLKIAIIAPEQRIDVY